MHSSKIHLSTDFLKIFELYFMVFLHVAKNFDPQKLKVHFFAENLFLPIGVIQKNFLGGGSTKKCDHD